MAKNDRSKLLSVLFGLFLAIGNCVAQSPTEIQAYVERYKTLAIEHERLYGIPAPITLAQGILESKAGLSDLAVKANNHFGIKALGNWSGSVYYAWDDEPIQSKFRVYETAEESFLDHSQILKANSRYHFLFKYSIYDYRSWAKGLQKAGYATGKNYAKTLISYIDTYKLYNVNGGWKLKSRKKKGTKQIVIVEENEERDIDSVPEPLEEDEETEPCFTYDTIESINGLKCAVIFPGETISSIAERYDIPVEKLLKYNESIDETDFKEGDIVFLQKKKRKYRGTQDTYCTQGGETFYEIAQLFGIQTHRLAKMNHKDAFTTLEPGEILRLK